MIRLHAQCIHTIQHILVIITTPRRAVVNQSICQCR